MKITIEEKINEGIATAEYFIKKKKLHTADYTFVLDIGGGSTEIAFVYQGNILFNDSIKFAGNNFVLAAPILYRNITDEILSDNDSEEDLMLQRFNLIFSSDEYLLSGWKGKLDKFMEDKKFSQEVYFLNSIFFGSLMYYLGMHLSRIKSLQLNKLKIALAGNGSRFLEIITFGNKLDDKILSNKWNEFFLDLIRGGYSLNIERNIDELKEIDLIFTDEPKNEVVFGLLYSEDRISDKNSSVEKMLGLDVELNNVIYKYYDWPKENVKVIDFRKAKIDFKIFEKFLDLYWKKVMQLTDSIKYIEINLEKVKNLLLASLESRNDELLVTPLFFECIFTYMKEFTKENMK